MREQFYVFAGPDGWSMVERFGPDGHFVLPGPCRDIAAQVDLLGRLHPGVLVDTLDDPAEIADALAHAARQQF